MIPASPGGLGNAGPAPTSAHHLQQRAPPGLPLLGVNAQVESAGYGYEQGCRRDARYQAQSEANRRRPSRAKAAWSDLQSQWEQAP